MAESENSTIPRAATPEAIRRGIFEMDEPIWTAEALIEALIAVTTTRTVQWNTVSFLAGELSTRFEQVAREWRTVIHLLQSEIETAGA